MEVYAISGRGKVAAVGGALRTERIKEAYKEVKALLRMLTHVTNMENSGDDDDRGGGPAAVAAAAAAAALAGGQEGRVRRGVGAGGRGLRLSSPHLNLSHFG